MPVNAELLNRTYDYIVAHPTEWNQGAWAQKTECGPACCFAGRAVALAHPTAEFDFEKDVIEGDDFENSYCVKLPGETELRSIRELAQELLGLGEGDAERLFDAYNDLEDIAVTIENILYAAGLAAPASPKVEG